jgi:imidazolonepropionase-like amidohydrolase
MVPDLEYENGHILVSQSCKKLADSGVKVNLGAHGQIQGIGAHWELWMLKQGGMSTMQALECATINGAYYIGMEKDLGSLEKGKLADLVVLEKNPLIDIKNSELIIYTMANGRLYDAATMNETGNYDVKRGKFFWEDEKYGNAFDWHLHSHGDDD